MCRSHYYREFYSPDIVWDSAQMIVTLKLSSVAINYGDGAVSKEKKTPTMVKNELESVPELLPYFGAHGVARCIDVWMCGWRADAMEHISNGL